MFPTLLHLQKQFYQVFVGSNFQTPVQVPNIGDVPAYSTKISSDDYTEAVRESYPQIAIEELMPDFSDRFNNDFRNYQVVGNELVDVSGDNHRPVFNRSFFMEIPFNVHFVTKKAMEQYRFRQLMTTTFGPKGFLTFDGYPDYEIFEEGVSESHKETIEYSVNRSVVDREDGVLQDVYQFTLLAWISSGDPELLPVIETINIGLTIQNTTP